jgi:DNA-directed RNA polymerase
MIETNTNKVQLPEYDEQEALLESLMVSGGQDRYAKNVKKAHENKELSTAESNVVEASIRAVADEIRKVLQDVKAEREAAGGRGRVAGWVLPVSLVDADLLAYIALNQAFIGTLGKNDLRYVIGAIGAKVEMEVWSLNLQAKDPTLFKRLVKMAVKHNDTQAYRIRSFKAIAKKEGHPYEVWDDEYRAIVGGMLLNAVLTATQLFEAYDVYDNGQIEKVCIGLTKEAGELVQRMDNTYALSRPMFMPMKTMPKPWEDMFTGCYHDKALSSQLPFLRTHNQEQIRLVQDAFEKGTMAPVVRAVNSIQSVPLRINRRMYEVLSYCWKEKLPVKGLPAFVKYPLPEFPGEDEWKAMSIGQQKLWKKERKTCILKNRAMEADWLQLNQDLGIAQEFLGTPFGLPHSLDFRGRVYPIPFFSHHRSDHIKNLFEFANGLPLNATGVDWLAVHVASTGDFDKVSKESFSTRIQWTIDNSKLIEEIGNDPEGTVDQWTCADKPFSFVAACIEWAGYKREGASYVSHLPIPLDGSNSGLQHFSAASRCEVGGSLVNLIKAGKPADVYATVARLCADQVEVDALGGDNQAVALLWQSYGVNRKVVKRSVMVFAYSSEKFGFRKQILQDLMHPIQDDLLRGRLDAHPFGSEESYTKAASYMASLVWDAVNIVVVRAAEGMRFLQKCSSALAHEAKPVNWTTPMGLPVQNMYQEYTIKRVELFLHDRKVNVKDAKVYDKVTKDGNVNKRLQIAFNSKPTGVIKKVKSKSTIAANWIHSLDACHLQSAVNAAVDEGITDLLLIHDSFGTHAANAGRFQNIIKRTFIDMYEMNDVFNQFRERVLQDISDENRDKIPALPTKGSLDIKGVMDSDYCFS